MANNISTFLATYWTNTCLPQKKNVMNNGWNMYIYKESFSPNLEKTLTFDCFKDKNNKNNETAKNVELI